MGPPARSKDGWQSCPHRQVDFRPTAQRNRARFPQSIPTMAASTSILRPSRPVRCAAEKADGESQEMGWPGLLIPLPMSRHGTVILSHPSLRSGWGTHILSYASKWVGHPSGVLPDLPPGYGVDDFIKAGGKSAAAAYAINRGLIVPLRSSIYRGILEGTETVASGTLAVDFFVRTVQGAWAEAKAIRSGTCH